MGEQKKNTNLSQENTMLAIFAPLAFIAAALVALCAVASTFRESQPRIFDALRGRPLERIKPLLCVSA